MPWSLFNATVLHKLRVGDEAHPSGLDLSAGNPWPASAVSKETDSHVSHANAKNFEHFMAYSLHSSVYCLSFRPMVTVVLILTLSTTFDMSFLKTRRNLHLCTFVPKRVIKPG